MVGFIGDVSQDEKQDDIATKDERIEVIDENI
jgi:hypothetical protein